MRGAVASLLRAGDLAADDLPWLMLGCMVAIELRDDEAHSLLAEHHVQLARSAGSLALLPTYLNLRAGAHIVAGELTKAAALIGEAYAIAAATGSAELVYADLALRGWRGDKRAVSDLIASSSTVAHANGPMPVYIEYTTAVLNNGLGDYQAALDATTEAEKYDELGLNAFVAPERVEAAARLARPDLAAQAIERLSLRARICKTDWAVGMELRSRALLSDGPDTDDLYREAIARLARTRLKAHVARTQLVYGEWLRRQRRRADAREHLLDAHESLSGMGAKAFARRAARELQATGERPRERGRDALDTLTVQEVNIARRAASGETSKEIAASLFLSPRTIDAHLRSIFRKTGVTSRRELRDVTLLDHDGLTSRGSL
jgi:DNA-binding CsgD family transcriptional regulator